MKINKHKPNIKPYIMILTLALVYLDKEHNLKPNLYKMMLLIFLNKILSIKKTFSNLKLLNNFKLYYKIINAKLETNAHFDYIFFICFEWSFLRKKSSKNL